MKDLQSILEKHNTSIEDLVKRLEDLFILTRPFTTLMDAEQSAKWTQIFDKTMILRAAIELNKKVNLDGATTKMPVPYGSHAYQDNEEVRADELRAMEKRFDHFPFL